MMPLTGEYDHKATSESFNGAEKVSIHFSKLSNEYAVYVHANQEEDGKTLYVSKGQLELIIHAGKDVLDDLRV
jgi:hypothetical protein